MTGDGFLTQNCASYSKSYEDEQGSRARAQSGMLGLVLDERGPIFTRFLPAHCSLSRELDKLKLGRLPSHSGSIYTNDRFLLCEICAEL